MGVVPLCEVRTPPVWIFKGSRKESTHFGVLKLKKVTNCPVPAHEGAWVPFTNHSFPTRVETEQPRRRRAISGLLCCKARQGGPSCKMVWPPEFMDRLFFGKTILVVNKAILTLVKPMYLGSDKSNWKPNVAPPILMLPPPFTDKPLQRNIPRHLRFFRIEVRIALRDSKNGAWLPFGLPLKRAPKRVPFASKRHEPRSLGVFASLQLLTGVNTFVNNRLAKCCGRLQANGNEELSLREDLPFAFRSTGESLPES